jgi:hypothetical protein
MAVDLIPDRRAAKPAPVFVFIPFRQHEKQKLVDRHRPPALRAVKLGGLEFTVACLPLVSFLPRIAAWRSSHIHIRFPFSFSYDNAASILITHEKKASINVDLVFARSAFSHRKGAKGAENVRVFPLPLRGRQGKSIASL